MGISSEISLSVASGCAATTASSSSPYFSSFARPIPLTRSSASSDSGRCSATSCSVASFQTTNAGTLSASAVSLRQDRSASKSASS